MSAKTKRNAPAPTPTPKKKGKKAAPVITPAPTLKTPERLQQIADQLHYRHGDNFRNWPDYADRLKEFDLTPDEITDQIWERADRNGRNKLRAHAKETNGHGKVRVVIDGDPEFPPPQVRLHREEEATPTPEGVKPAAAKKEPAPKSAAPSKGRYELFGFAITAVLRWMGSEGWDAQEATTALTRLDQEYGCLCAKQTIQIQVRAGAKGERGEPAPLTTAQAEQLYAALGGERKEKVKK